jgi:hypothetical protein
MSSLCEIRTVLMQQLPAKELHGIQQIEDGIHAQSLALS